MTLKAEDIKNVAHDAKTRASEHLVKFKLKSYMFFTKTYTVDPSTVIATIDNSAIIAGKEPRLIKLKNIKSVSIVPK